MTTSDTLKTISRAWGKQSGYCFFPWIDGNADSREVRIQSYHEGPAFLWPRDKGKIVDHLDNHIDDDLYWCPSLFEKPVRQLEYAMDEHALWADLDEIDPREIKDYPPTIAWETSPGHYQALWIIMGGDMQGASWMGYENQRLTYHLDADKSGWDTTQLLRIPGRANHKFNYWSNGTRSVPGKILWTNGRRWLPDEFNELPPVAGTSQITSILEGEIEKVDRREVWGRVRLKVSGRVRDFYRARETSGDRSDVLWQMERDLADAGCTVVEIVALVKETVWNKYDGRQDEVKRLTIEAAKAVELRAEPTTDPNDMPEPQNIMDALANISPPQWLVKGILTKGSCGFIAGQPKVHKSWFGLDLALSVSEGMPFLEHFRVAEPGPVLYIQEEDSIHTIASRFRKMWSYKKSDKLRAQHDAEGREIPPIWVPAEEHDDKPKVNIVVQKGVTISDEVWQGWLDEQLEKGYVEEGERTPYMLVVIDPLMMVAGTVEENRAQEMVTKIFKPLKQLATKHNVAVQLVHHMKKGDAQGQRGGQMMLGSVANHAWSENSLYLKVGRGGALEVERESKNAPSGSFKVTGIRNKRWEPVVTNAIDDQENDAKEPRERAGRQARSPRARGRKPFLNIQTALRELGKPSTTKQVAEHMSISPDGARKQLKRAQTVGKVTLQNFKWSLAED